MNIDRNLRKERIGIVTSNKMKKSIIISEVKRTKHPMYGKYVLKTKKYTAHDEENKCNVGDTVNFAVNAPGHPFLIKDQAGTGKKNSVKEIEKNGLSKGIIEWEPKQKGTYYYQCIKHKNMVGKIIIK